MFMQQSPVWSLYITDSSAPSILSGYPPCAWGIHRERTGLRGGISSLSSHAMYFCLLCIREHTPKFWLNCCTCKVAVEKSSFQSLLFIQEMEKYASYVILFTRALMNTHFHIINLWQTECLLDMLMLWLAIISLPEKDHMQHRHC